MKKLHIPPLGKLTKRFLRLAMPSVLLTAVAILITYLDAREQNLLLANANYAPLLEYITTSMVIVFGGGVLIEIAQWER